MQRLGRTEACKRDGRCVLLMTEHEKHKYEETKRQAARVVRLLYGLEKGASQSLVRFL